MRRTPRLPGSAEACWGLVLAAGGGRRFGGAKLLAPLAGRPLLAHALDVVCSAVAADVLRGALAVVPAGETRLTSIL
ncbi:MAG: NTP transferase domain-containing protein, partial [Gemmatimonadota bacterium]